jgi:hypothetical protein
VLAHHKLRNYVKLDLIIKLLVLDGAIRAVILLLVLIMETQKYGILIMEKLLELLEITMEELVRLHGMVQF